MKKSLQISVCAAALLLTFTAHAQKTKEDEQTHQKKIERIAGEACECTDDISSAIPKDSIIAKINSCISSGILAIQMEKMLGSLDELKEKAESSTSDTVHKNIVIYADEDFDEIQSYMRQNCERVKTLMATDDVQSKYSMSKDKKALEYYYEGIAYKDKENYDLAIVSFNKAVKQDKKFAFAWDNLGICYRKRGNYEEAIKCYERSLEIDPNGGLPLQNLPIAYEYLKDYKKAGECYEKLIKRNPKDPEGYFGAGRIFYLQGDLEKASDSMFKAYNLYEAAESPYIDDALQNLRFYYQELKKAGKEEVFKTIAKNNGIELD